jgi:hypothetical protein
VSVALLNTLLSQASGAADLAHRANMLASSEDTNLRLASEGEQLKSMLQLQEQAALASRYATDTALLMAKEAQMEAEMEAFLAAEAAEEERINEEQTRRAAERRKVGGRPDTHHRLSRINAPRH